MTIVANQDIRKFIKEAGLKAWQVADAMGLQDSNFSKMLRRELPPDKKNRILETISHLAAGKGA